MQTEPLYQLFNVHLYKNSNVSSVTESQDGSLSSISVLSGSGDNIQPEDFISGSIAGNLEYTGGYIQSANFVSGSIGWRLDSNGTLTAVNATLSGSITATSGTIGGFSISSSAITATNLVLTSGAANTANITVGTGATAGGLNSAAASGDIVFWAGSTFANRATAPFRVTAAGALTVSSASITGGSIVLGSNASIDSSGNATFIGVTTLNIKVYTCFEDAGRFTASADTAAVFTTQGVTIAPGTVANHFCKLLWQTTGFVFANNASFVANVQCFAGFTAGDGRGFVGLGNPTISGSSFTETGANYCGFEFKKVSGVTTIIAVQCDGGGTVTFSGTLATVTNGSFIELYIKMRSGAIDYYTRLNGGALSAATTLSATIPTGSETNIQFSSSNMNSTDNFSMIYMSAAYEH